MKYITIALVVLNSISSFAAEIVNEKTGARIEALCLERNEASCTLFSITHSVNGSKSEISKFLVKPLSATETFQLKEIVSAHQFDYFPVTKATYVDRDGTIEAGTAGMFSLGGAIGFIPALFVWDQTNDFGTGVGVGLLITAGVMALPMVADVVAMPVRLLLRKAELRRANKTEIFAMNMLGTLTDEKSNASVSISNKKFSQLTRALSTIKN